MLNLNDTLPVIIKNMEMCSTNEMVKSKYILSKLNIVFDIKININTKLETKKVSSVKF